MIPLIQIILAITLPSFVIWKSNKPNALKQPQLFIIGSFACCAWGIISELTTIKARLLARDIGGIEDTIDSVIIISIVIVVITVIVNLIALGISFEKNINS